MNDNVQSPLLTEENGHAAPVTELEQPATESAPALEQGGEWRAEAGRKGARRVHQLIQEGRLYEREHGLTSGRQRLRQLLELGKLYEREHKEEVVGEQPPRRRLERMEREELLGTLMQCLLRMAKPSFRAELELLVAALTPPSNDHAA